MYEYVYNMYELSTRAYNHTHSHIDVHILTSIGMQIFKRCVFMYVCT